MYVFVYLYLYSHCRCLVVSCVICLLLVILIFIIHISVSSPQVSYSDGTVEGYHVNGVNQWKGLPFAAPPVNHNRFRPPQPVSPWSGVRSAMTNQNICPQVRLTDK